jgi:voltage-gated potassium channel
MMAATALRPLAVTFMDLISGCDCEVEEFRLSPNPSQLGSLNGISLGELQLGRRTGALVLAVRSPVPDGEPELVVNPGRELRLMPGQLLVVMGSKAQLLKVEQLFGAALRSVDHLAG